MSRLEDRLKKLKEELEASSKELTQLEPETDIEDLPEFQIKEIKDEKIETNPHKVYKEIIKNPAPKGAFVMNLRGRPIDVHDLENYLVFKISPKTITTIMRYSDSKTIAEALNLARPKKRTAVKNLAGIISLLIILIAVGLFLAFGGMSKILALFHFIH